MSWRESEKTRDNELVGVKIAASTIDNAAMEGAAWLAYLGKEGTMVGSRAVAEPQASIISAIF